MAPPPLLQLGPDDSARCVGSPFTGVSSPAMKPMTHPGSSVFSFGTYQAAPMLQVVGGQTLPPRAGPSGTTKPGPVKMSCCVCNPLTPLQYRVSGRYGCLRVRFRHVPPPAMRHDEATQRGAPTSL